MTKEEIKSMIDATINENGDRNITGKALNLALNAIVDAMGEGGGLDTVYLIPFNPTEVGALSETDEFWTLDDIMAMIEHNKTIYEKIANKFTNEKSIPQISVDASIFAALVWGYNKAVINVPGSVVCFKVDESMPSIASYNENDHYNVGDIAVFITPSYEDWTGFDSNNAFWLQKNGVCGMINSGGEE